MMYTPRGKKSATVITRVQRPQTPQRSGKRLGRLVKAVQVRSDGTGGCTKDLGGGGGGGATTMMYFT